MLAAALLLVKASDMLCGEYAALTGPVSPGIIIWFRWGSIMEPRRHIQHSLVNALGTYTGSV